MRVGLGDLIEIRYKGWKKRNGEVFENNEDKSLPPTQITLGAREFLPGLNEGIVGMKSGEIKEIFVPSEKGFGKKKPELIQAMPRISLLGKVEPKVGKILIMKDPKTGQNIPAIIAGIKDETVILDMNAPLAGEDLVFKVKLERIIRKSRNHISA